MAILVTGGCGYIGSAIVRRLRDNGVETVVVDNLSTGHRHSVPNDAKVKFFEADFANENLLRQLALNFDIEAVIHTAALLDVAKSFELPYRYFNENVVATMRMFARLAEFDVKKIIFSSSAAAVAPESSPYAASKNAIEQELQWLYRAHKVQSISLRYFNVFGADQYGFGQFSKRPSHLVPNILQVAAGEQPYLTVYNQGQDIRDYVHVDDVVDANMIALQKIAESTSPVYNVGTGNGTSTMDVIRVAQLIMKKDIPIVFKGGRDKEPGTLVANIKYSKDSLGWQPVNQGVYAGIQSAWEFKQKFPKGY